MTRTLNRNGIENRTLVPGAHQTLIYVVDFKDELRRQVIAAARELGARRRVLRGTGDFIGDDDRDKAQQVFSEIITKFENEHPPLQNNCVAVATSAASVTGATPGSAVVAIAAARRLPLGTVVTIEGSVTVPSGTFKASINDEGFALQDRSGGIYVSVQVNSGLRLHDRVRVTGKLAESLGMMMVVPESASAIEARGAGSYVRPERAAAGKIDEATEGRLVRVTGTMTRAVMSDLPYGYRVFLDDGTGEVQIFVSASTGIDPRGLRQGRRLSVTGLSGQYKEHYEVSPRFASDMASRRHWKRRPAP